jgi:hypothetical protein
MAVDKFEQKVSKALSANGSQTAAEIAALLDELETAISAATEAAKLQREASLDPSQMPNPVAARVAVEDAEFRVGRLKTLLPRLRQRYTVVVAHEEAAQARQRAAPLIAERDRLSDELRALLPYLGKLADCFIRVTNNSNAINRLAATLPAHATIFIRDAELEARGLERFTRDSPSILKDAVLPGLDGRMLWPPPRSVAEVTAFAAPTYDPRNSPEWGLHRDQETARAEAAEIAAAKQAEEAAEQMARELNMPQWWKGETR